MTMNMNMGRVQNTVKKNNFALSKGQLLGAEDMGVGAIAPPRVYMCFNHAARSSRARGGVTLALRAARHARENPYTHTLWHTDLHAHKHTYARTCLRVHCRSRSSVVQQSLKPIKPKVGK